MHRKIVYNINLKSIEVLKTIVETTVDSLQLTVNSVSWSTLNEQMNHLFERCTRLLASSWLCDCALIRLSLRKHGSKLPHISMCVCNEDNCSIHSSCFVGSQCIEWSVKCFNWSPHWDRSFALHHLQLTSTALLWEWEYNYRGESDAMHSNREWEWEWSAFHSSMLTRYELHFTIMRCFSKCYIHRWSNCWATLLMTFRTIGWSRCRWCWIVKWSTLIFHCNKRPSLLHECTWNKFAGKY